jgi:hypothetical protein
MVANDNHKHRGINNVEDFLEYFKNIKYNVKNNVQIILNNE